MRLRLLTRTLATVGCLYALSSCMAPNCPIKSCHVRKEHRHGGVVYRGVLVGSMHGPGWWLSNRRGEGVASSSARESKGPKQKKPKFKKVFEWEKQ